jgi:hypothetical protein
MQVAFLALLPVFHIFLAVVCVVGAVANFRRNPGLAGFLALLAAVFVTVSVWFFLTVLQAG